MTLISEPSVGAITKLNYSYLTGVFLAINSIDGAYIVLDAPNCVSLIGDNIFLNHDSFSNILDPRGPNRILHTTQSNVCELHKNRTGIILNKLKDTLELSKGSVVFFSSMPANSLTGIDYESTILSFNKNNHTSVIYLPQKSMTHDWLDGFRDVMGSLASNLSLKKRNKIKNSIGIVGYFWDRNEGDHRGNINELRRILQKAGISLVSVWTQGKTIDTLKDIEKAELIVCFPHYKQIAEKIAKTTGSKILELGLPFGLEKTKEFLEKISSFFNIDCSDILKQELEATTPLCSRFLDFIISDNTFSFYGDPYLGIAIHQAIESMGGKFDNMIFFSRSREDVLVYFESVKDKPLIQFEPLSSKIIKKESDIHIGNSTLVASFLGKSYVLIGYPSLGNHYFYDHPFLGFKGFILFLNQIYNSIRGKLIS